MMTAGGRSPGSSQYPQPIFEAQLFDQRFTKPAAAQQSHYRFSEIRQTRSGIGRRGTAERHAVSEHVGPTPDRAERAKSSGMQDFEHLEILIDGLCAFDMKDRGEHAAVQAVLYLFDVPANAKGAL